MSRLRDAAARFIDHGTWLGVIASRRATRDHLGSIIERAQITDKSQEFAALFDDCKQWHRQLTGAIDAAEASAARARTEAERLMTSLEHPGARLARRLVAAARGARAAWRAAR